MEGLRTIKGGKHKSLEISQILWMCLFLAQSSGSPPYDELRHDPRPARSRSRNAPVGRRHRRHADARTPGQEFLRGSVVGPARVRVADVGREEFEEAHRGALAGGSDEFGQPALWSGYLQHVRIHDASSGREMRNKGARRAP